MTQAMGQHAEAAGAGEKSGEGERPPETFAGVTLRRLRYVVAIGLGVLLFLALAWALVRPPADMAGVSLLYWHGAGGLLGAAVVAALMAAAVALSMLLCHPDTPYTGMWCAFLALSGVSMRGGDIRMMLEQAQTTGTTARLYQTLAVECLLWLAIIAVAEMTTRLLWHRFFGNTVWLKRAGLPAAMRERIAAGALPREYHAAKPAGNLWLENGQALLVCGAVAFVILRIWVQSELKGQVLGGAFVAFGLGALVARLLSPSCSAWALWAAIPLTVAVGYWLAPGVSAVKDGALVVGTRWWYPGHAISAIGRGLPIDYVTFGVPGAILGYYGALKMQIHAAASEEKEKPSR